MTVPVSLRVMLKTVGIAESALYVDDLDRAAKFYTSLLSLRVLHRDDRLCALEVAPEQVLLLFHRGASTQPTKMVFGVIPAHDGAGPLHVCFGIRQEDLPEWERKIQQLGAGIESRVQWPGGATSLYFRDPDNHAVELATPGLWK
jgi:catechol 2,3-dioxygenase-like lactoylglutathione lyase family enzyme